MALLGWEGWDVCTASGGALPPSALYATFAGSPTTNTTTRFSRGRSLLLSSSATLDLPLGSAKSTLCFGGAFTVSSISSTAPLLQFIAVTTVILSVFVYVDGSLEIVRGSTKGSNVLYRSAAGLLAVSTWNYLGYAITRHASAGIITFEWNGITIATTTALNTGASDIDFIRLSNILNNVQWDDCYWKDDITLLGDVTCELNGPSADSSVAWTKNGGAANFSRVNEQPSDGDTTYVASSTVSQKDRYDMADLSINPTTVYGVKTLIAARKDDATARQIRANTKSGSTTTNGATKTLSTSYAGYSDIALLNPDTGTAWTKTTVDALQIEIEVVT